MILDTSAIVAIVVREPGWEGLLDKLARAPERGVGAPTLAEAGIVLSARLRADARALLVRLLQEFEIETLPFEDAHWREAIEAWSRFGKGRHRAALNFGDCLAFATARLAGRPLLCVGGDFARTDVERG